MLIDDINDRIKKEREDVKIYENLASEAKKQGYMECVYILEDMSKEEQTHSKYLEYIAEIMKDKNLPRICHE